MFSAECRHCGSTEHASGNCTHGFFSSKCRHCGSVDHASDDCPHGIFSSNKCSHCGSKEHASGDCPHGIFSSNKCRHCGSVDHASDDCPHGLFSSECRHCGSKNHQSSNCPHGIFSSRRQSNNTTNSNNTGDGNSGCGLLIVIGIAIAIALWLIFNVVLPLAFLNSALILTILGFYLKKNNTLLHALSLVGGAYLLVDISECWLSGNFVFKVVKDPGWITLFVYINMLAVGLSTYTLIRPLWEYITERPSEKPYQNVLAKGGIVAAISLSMLIFPYFYHFVDNRFVPNLGREEKVSTPISQPVPGKKKPTSFEKINKDNPENPLPTPSDKGLLIKEIGNGYSKFNGAWFEVEFPTSFKYVPSQKSKTGKGYDSAHFISPDKKVEFYVFSPQWEGIAEDIQFMPETETLTLEKTSQSTKDAMKWVTYTAKDNSYIRSYQETLNSNGKVSGVIGLKYSNQNFYNKYKQEYLRFKKSLQQFAD